MMDFVDLARRAASTSNPVSLGELEATVRAALADIVAGTDATCQPVSCAGSSGAAHLGFRDDPRPGTDPAQMGVSR